VRLVASILLVSQRGDHRGAILLGRGGDMAKAVAMEYLPRSGLVQRGLFPAIGDRGSGASGGLGKTMLNYRQEFWYVVPGTPAHTAHSLVAVGLEADLETGERSQAFGDITRTACLISESCHIRTDALASHARSR
jgi:hypothetical protein